MKTAISLMLAVALLAPLASAQVKKPTYEEALACYAYYGAAADLAKGFEKSDKPTADEAAGFELQAIAAKRLQAHWSMRIQDVAGKRTDPQIDADLKTHAAPVIADADAALKGDKAAAERGRARGDRCSTFQNS